MKSIVVVLALCCTIAMGQRSPYAGSRPIGSFSNQNTGNRNDAAPATQPQPAQQAQGTRPSQPQQAQGARPNQPQGAQNAQGLPYQAGGDVNYYNYLQTLPQNQQPFWLLNQQHIAANRNQPNFQVSPFAQPSHFAG